MVGEIVNLFHFTQTIALKIKVFIYFDIFIIFVFSFNKRKWIIESLKKYPKL